MRREDKSLQRLLSGFIRIHILHHADEADLCGNWMMEELRHHGYNISPGTLYPMLKAMERDGWIAGRDADDGTRRRPYRITVKGREAKVVAGEKLSELFSEVGGTRRKRHPKKQ